MNGKNFPLVVLPINAFGQFALDSSAEGNYGECITRGNIFSSTIHQLIVYSWALFYFILFFFSKARSECLLAIYPGRTPPSPNVSWDRLQPPRDREKDERFQIMDGWEFYWHRNKYIQIQKKNNGVVVTAIKSFFMQTPRADINVDTSAADEWKDWVHIQKHCIFLCSRIFHEATVDVSFPQASLKKTNTEPLPKKGHLAIAVPACQCEKLRGLVRIINKYIPKGTLWSAVSK